MYHLRVLKIGTVLFLRVDRKIIYRIAAGKILKVMICSL